MNLKLVVSPKAKWLVFVFFLKINLVIITRGLWFLCIVYQVSQ